MFSRSYVKQTQIITKIKFKLTPYKIPLAIP